MYVCCDNFLLPRIPDDYEYAKSVPLIKALDLALALPEFSRRNHKYFWTPRIQKFPFCIY